MKRKAKKLYSGCPAPQKYANNLTLCSKRCCGNPRKHSGDVTIQEEKAKFDERSQA